MSSRVSIQKTDFIALKKSSFFITFLGVFAVSKGKGNLEKI